MKIIEFLVHMKGGGLGPADDASAYHQYRSEFPQGSGCRQGNAVGQPPPDGRNGNPPECMPDDSRPECVQLLPVPRPHSLSTGTTSRTTNGQGYENGRQYHAGKREDDMDAALFEPAAKPSGLAEKDDKHESGHYRGNSQGQVHQTIEEGLSPEILVRKDQCQDQPEKGIDENGDNELIQRVSQKA